MKFLNLFLTAQLFVFIAFAQIKISPIVNPPGLPIKPQRTINITTNEASYLDVDVSPDSSTLLFSCLGELFSLPATGGTARQLTHGLAINRCPIWSPDGKLIAYESDATGFVKLHVTNLSGSFQKVLDVRTYGGIIKPTWFPDSKQVNINDKVYHLTGIISSLPEVLGRIIDFSPDGRFVYSWEYISSDSSALIKYDRLSPGKKSLLVLSSKLFIFNNVRISPDGNWLTYIKFQIVDLPNGVYTSSDSLMALDLKTGKEKLLSQLNIKFVTHYLKNQHYSFSRDSKHLFIGYGGKIHRIEIETGKNDIIPFTAKVKVNMGALDYNTYNVSFDSFDVKYVRSTQKSPDGKHLVFSALNKIYIQDLLNGKPHILVDQPFNQFEPTYSPDGKWICYVSWSDTEGGYLWRVSSLGGTPEQLTTIAGLYQHPSWSFDGKMVVVFKGENRLGQGPAGEGELQIISIKDKTAKVIEDRVPLFNRAVFSKAGDQIIFTPNQQNADNKLWPRLVSIDIETKAKTVLAYARNFEDVYFPIRQTVLSPDGKYCTFAYNEDIYLAPMANIGGVQSIFDNVDNIKLIRFARGAIDPNWEEGDQALSWVSGNQYCRINPNKIIEAAVHLQTNKTLKGLPQTKIIDVNIPADQTIAIKLKVPRLYGKGIIALKNVRIITMHGDRVVENGTVLINDGRFLSVGATSKVTIPKGAEIFDMKGKTIMPGFIDMHSHMYAIPPNIFYQQSWSRLLNFASGITTARDPAGSYDEFGYGELTEAGQMVGPRMYMVGGAVREHYNLTSLEEAKIVVSNRKKFGATYIKQYQQPTRQQRQLLLQACEEEGVNMTNEVEKEPLYCLGMYKDGSTGVEHNTEWGDVYDDVIKLVAKSGIFLCPALQFCYGREYAKYYFHKLYGQDFINSSMRFVSDDYKENLFKEIREDNFDTGFLQQSRIDARIKHAGGKIIMGSHGEDQGIGAHWEIWALQMGGLTNMEALQTATITAAQGLGMQKDLGSIEVGKIADIIILDKNPLEDIHNTTSVRYVMKAGVLYESETLDEVWPEKRKCPEWRMKNEDR